MALSYDASTTEEFALRRQGSLMRASIPPAAAIGIVPDKTQQCRAAHLLHDRDPAVCAHRPHHGVDSIRQTLTTAILAWLSVLLLTRFASALQAAALVLHALAPCVRAHRPHQSFDATRRDPGLVVSIVIDEFRQSAEPCCCTPTTPRCARIAPTTVSIPDAVILALLWASSPAQCNTAARPCSLRALPCREQDLRVPLRLQRRNAALKRRRRRGVECVRERDQRDTL